MNPEFYWIAVAVVAVLSAARVTRLLVVDEFPPIKKVRDWYEERTDGSGWQMISYCSYCMSPWVTLAVVLWGWLTDFGTAWWVVNGAFAASYVAAFIVRHDKGKVGE